MNKSNNTNNRSQVQRSQPKQKAQQRPSQRQMSGDERIVNRTTQRRRKNRRNKIIARMVVGLIFLIIGVILVLTMFFNIAAINVMGDTVYSAQQVIEKSEIEIGDNLIFISKKDINEKITTQLPYVDSVEIKRKLPSEMEIIVTKTQAKFAVFVDGYYTLLNANGKVLESGLEFVGEGITIINVGEIAQQNVGYSLVLENEKTFTKLMLVERALEECELSGITSIDLSDIYSIKLVYEGRITLELGETDSENITKKLALGKAAIETQNEENPEYRGTINLTVDGKGYWGTEPESTSEKPTESVTGEAASENENSTEISSEGIQEAEPEGTTAP